MRTIVFLAIVSFFDKFEIPLLFFSGEWSSFVRMCIVVMFFAYVIADLRDAFGERVKTVKYKWPFK